MINVRELRIGNTVKGGDYTLNPSSIIKIETGLATARSESDNDFTSIDGIPLANIDLSRYGFTYGYIIHEVDLLGKSFDGIDIGLKIAGNGVYEVFIMRLSEEKHFVIRRISFLHELQNLVFALFGVEL